MPNMNRIPFSSESMCQVPKTSATCKTSVQLQEACQMMLYASYTHQKALLYLPNAGSIHKSQNKKAKWNYEKSEINIENEYYMK